MNRLLFVVGLLVIGCAKSAPPTDGSAATGTSSTTTPPATDECPKDLSGATGKPCPTNGKTCAPSGAFTHLIMCSHGKWIEMDAPPPPPPPPPH